MLPERFHFGDAEILVGADADEAIRIAAGQFAALARKIAAAGRTTSVALSGGSTPRRLFEALAAAPFSGIVPWDSVQFFWGDERNVPPGHKDSNYSLAHKLLLSRVSVPAANIHRIPTGDGTAIEAADLYERTLREKLPMDHGVPRLDYNLLGLGSNGHTASLFPGRPTLHECKRFVVADHVDEVNAWRVSLTAPVLNNAAQITFLVLGKEKAAVVKRVVEGPREPETTPAQLIAPRDGTLTWILDSAAASQLTRPNKTQEIASTGNDSA